MEKKYKLLLSGLFFVPTMALLDTIIFQQRTFTSYIAICLFEWLIFFVGVVIGEVWYDDKIERKIEHLKIKSHEISGEENECAYCRALNDLTSRK